MEGLCSGVLHNSCLLLLLKESSSPTGYTCPSCKSQIWPTKKQIFSSGSSLANRLGEVFAKVLTAHINLTDVLSLICRIIMAPSWCKPVPFGMNDGLEFPAMTAFQLPTELMLALNPATVDPARFKISFRKSYPFVLFHLIWRILLQRSLCFGFNLPLPCNA